MTNFKNNLLETASEIEKGSGSVLKLADASRQAADESRLASENIGKETDVIKAQTEEINKNTEAKKANAAPRSKQEKPQSLNEDAAVKLAEEARARDLSDIEKQNAAKVELKRKQIEEIAALEEEERIKKEELRLLESDRALLEKEEGFAALEEQLGREEALRQTARAQAIETATGDQKKADIVRGKARQKALDADIKAESAKLNFTKLSLKQQVDAASVTSGLLVQATQNSGSLGKKAAIADATIKGFQAVQTALNAPFPLNIVNSALVAAITAQNISKIKSAPAFQDGGIVPGNSFSGDKVQANVNSGEMILNQRQQSGLFSAIDTGSIGGGGTSINITGNVIADDESQIDRLMERIKDAQEYRNQSILPAF